MISSCFALPEDGQRLALNDELHARPPVRLGGAQHVVYLAVRHRPGEREAHRQALGRLAQAAGASVPPGVDHAVVTLAEGLRFKWEGHAEFASYTFFAEGGGEVAPAAGLERADWHGAAKSLAAEVLVAVSLDLVPCQIDSTPPDSFSAVGEAVLGGAIADGRGWAYTDFLIREDGFTHYLVLNREIGLGQAGRMVQTPEEVINKAARVENLGFVIVDFADLMIRGDSSESAMAHIYRTLALGSKSLGCPVMLLAQLVKYEQGIPKPKHLRYTKMAEALSWMILMLYNPSTDWSAAEDEKESDLLPVYKQSSYIIAWKIRGGFRKHREESPGAILAAFDGQHGWGDKRSQWFSLRKSYSISHQIYNDTML